MSSSNAAERLPVTIIAGFLGSGKTTLVSHILTNQHCLKVAVIVNEIGEIGIDAELIIVASDCMVELSNGCICCSLNNDLLDAAFRVLQRGEKVDYLVVECSGVADPLPIALTFLRSELRDLVRIDSIKPLPTRRISASTSSQTRRRKTNCAMRTRSCSINAISPAPTACVR